MNLRVAPVTVIVPVHNEAAGLPALFDRLGQMHARKATADWRFVFVDDGSNDDTLALLIETARRHRWIEVVHEPDNQGLGAALRTGFAYTASPIVCSMDSDCTYPPERLPELTALIEKGIDLTTASAWHPDARPAEGGRLRLCLSRTASKVYKFLVGQDVYTFTCLFRAYRREVLERVQFHSDGFAAVAEIMLGAMHAGYRIAEVPIPLEQRRYGESKLKISDAIFAHATLMTLAALHGRVGSTGPEGRQS
jgi:dolichol-phosphate mannosyltransferase